MNKKILLVSILLIGICAVFGYEFWQDTISRQNQTQKSISPQEQTDNTIASLERTLANNNDDTNTLISLANAYLQKVRETADSDLYTKVDELVERVEKIDPENPEIQALRAQVALGRHDFTRALELGQEANVVNPQSSTYLGIITDAHIELGNYDDAVTSLQQMMDIKPNYSAFMRTAYIRELYGDIEGAQESLEKAQSAGSLYAENNAATLVELGKLSLRSDLKRAEQHFNEALTVYPDYPPALQGLGNVSFAQKDYKKAIVHFDRAFTALPIAQYATDLGDVYSKMGEGKKAEQYYFLAQSAYEKTEQSGVNTDLEMTVFLSDHDIELEQALEKANAVYSQRPQNIYAADALAWALHKNGRSDEAQQYITEAMSLGEYHPLILFHAGVIAGKNGDPEESRRLLQKAASLHPNFSLQYSSVLSIL